MDDRMRDDSERDLGVRGQWGIGVWFEQRMEAGAGRIRELGGSVEGEGWRGGGGGGGM
jgi:hypothetical protein